MAAKGQGIRLIKILILVSVLFFQIATANEKQQDCSKIENDRKIAECAYANYQKIDAELNKVYKEILGFFDSKNKELLKGTQRSWLGYKEGDCKQVANRYSGGTLYPFILNECFAKKTQLRIGELIYLKELWEEI